MITIFGLALGALFIAIPLYVAYIYNLKMSHAILVSFVKVLVRIGILGGVLHFLMQMGNVWLTLSFTLFIIVLMSVVVVLKAHLRLHDFIIPVLGGMMVPVIVTGAMLLLANVSVGADFGIRYVLPVMALLSGGIVEPMSKSLATYYMGLLHHNHLYYYLVGNGASHAEALSYLSRRAIRQSLNSGLRTMSAVAVGIAPMMMWTMFMCGRSAVEATGWQLLMVLATLASSVMAVVLAMMIARRFVVDGYSRIKTAVAILLICSLCSCGDAAKRINAQIAENKRIVAAANAGHGHVAADGEKLSNIEIPAPLAGVSEQVLKRVGYTVSYNASLRVPNWVAWHLTATRIKGNTKRSGSSFHEDTDVPEPRAVNSDYVRSGYDRGHMCPAGDNKWNQQAMDESFLFTNVCPQAPSLNRGDWNEMEQACRKWAVEYGDVYVVCGPIFYRKSNKTIGKNHVAVPDAFFKVVLVMQGQPKAIGFIYKNGDGNRPKGDYANSVDEVERITGIDFFPSLPDDVENKIEAQCQPEEWNLGS